jgi:hypothetical protein
MIFGNRALTAYQKQEMGDLYERKGFISDVNRSMMYATDVSFKHSMIIPAIVAGGVMIPGYLYGGIMSSLAAGSFFNNNASRYGTMYGQQPDLEKDPQRLAMAKTRTFAQASAPVFFGREAFDLSFASEKERNNYEQVVPFEWVRQIVPDSLMEKLGPDSNPHDLNIQRKELFATVLPESVQALKDVVPKDLIKVFG